MVCAVLYLEGMAPKNVRCHTVAWYVRCVLQVYSARTPAARSCFGHQLTSLLHWYMCCYMCYNKVCAAYAAGVWRSHSCCLQLPLQQPANVAAAALQLPNGAVAVSITLSLEPNASCSLLLVEAALRPQYGLVHCGGSSSSSGGGLGLGFGGPSLSDVMPMRVLPGGSAALCCMLAQDQGERVITLQWSKAVV
jgi:hypothetical protein